MSVPALEFPVVTPENLGDQFYKDAATQKFRIHVNSTDPDNVSVTGEDGGAKTTQAIIQAQQLQYVAAYAPATKKITLYKVSNGVSAVVSEIDPNTFDVSVNGGSLQNGVLTLTESNGGATVTIDLNEFIRLIVHADSNAVRITGTGHADSPIVATFVVDPLTSNILKVGVAGARVDTQDILSFLNACTTISLGLVADDANGVIRLSVGGSTTTAQSVVLTDANGVRIGSLFA